MTAVDFFLNMQPNHIPNSDALIQVVVVYVGGMVIRATTMLLLPMRQFSCSDRLLSRGHAFRECKVHIQVGGLGVCLWMLGITTEVGWHGL
ncbi:hypothetical protein F5B20DRAFT_546242 [Whalleya microplaca]|nr:hypothetical protein F5B20DRAFT_546242 [Whalleya microplaca]